MMAAQKDMIASATCAGPGRYLGGGEGVSSIDFAHVFRELWFPSERVHCCPPWQL